MPRKSTAALLIPAPALRPATDALMVPATLLPDEVAVWQATIARAPWITADMGPLAEAYCRSAAAAHVLGERARAALDAEPASYRELQVAWHAELRVLGQLARSLRLTAQARVHKATAANNVRDVIEADFRTHFSKG